MPKTPARRTRDRKDSGLLWQSCCAGYRVRNTQQLALALRRGDNKSQCGRWKRLLEGSADVSIYLESAGDAFGVSLWGWWEQEKELEREKRLHRPLYSSPWARGEIDGLVSTADSSGLDVKLKGRGRISVWFARSRRWEIARQPGFVTNDVKS